VPLKGAVAASICHDGAVPKEVHLQMVQAVIARLASQSTTIKGWCVTVTAGVLTISTTTTANPVVAVISAYVVCAFSVIDSYYLAVERNYRELYMNAATDSVPEWTLAVSAPGLKGVLRAMASPSIYILYGTSMVVTLCVAAYLAAK
jgi:hypothetical protein